MMGLRSPPNNKRNNRAIPDVRGIPNVGKKNTIVRIVIKIINILNKYFFSIFSDSSKNPLGKFLINIPSPIKIKIYETILG